MVDEAEVESDTESKDELSEESSEGDSGGEDMREVSPEELLAVGKKCLAAGDANGAVENFQEACSILLVNHNYLQTTHHSASYVNNSC